MASKLSKARMERSESRLLTPKLEEMKEQGRAPEASPVSVTAPEMEMVPE